MDFHRPLILIAALTAGFLAGCNAPSDPASTPSAPSGDAQAPVPAPGGSPSAPVNPAPEAAPPAETPATPAATPSMDFAAAPSTGAIIRANCRMGGCWWYRLDEVKRNGTADAPRYALRVTGGESTHGQDPYPASPEGIAIQWDAKSASATVACSHQAPQVAYEGDARTLKLNPQGVSGVEQGVANLYFATCHGEYGDDGKLAAKYGYDVR